MLHITLFTEEASFHLSLSHNLCNSWTTWLLSVIWRDMPRDKRIHGDDPELLRWSIDRNSVATTITRLNTSWFLIVGILERCAKKKDNWRIERGNYERNYVDWAWHYDARHSVTQRLMHICLAETGLHFQHTMCCHFLQYEARYLSYQYCYILFIRSCSTATYLGFVLY